MDKTGFQLEISNIETLRIAELDTVLRIINQRNMCNATVLELGAGAGWQAKKIAGQGFAVAAIDMIEGEYTPLQVWPVLPYDGARMPFPEKCFDLVFSSNVLEHIRQLADVQQEIKRVIKPDGIAIHVLPSGSWRFWTNLAHYAHILRTLIGMLAGKTGRKSNQISVQSPDIRFDKNKSWSTRKTLSKLFPGRHGETGNALSEIYLFSKYRWKASFEEDGWIVDKIVPNRLFYTGYILLGGRLPLKLRKYLSYLLGSSGHIFVVRKLYSAREQNIIVKSLEHKWDADASMILSTGFQDQHR